MVPPYPRDGIRPRAGIDGRAECIYTHHCTLGQRPFQSLAARPGARRLGSIALGSGPWLGALLHQHTQTSMCPQRNFGWQSSGMGHWFRRSSPHFHIIDMRNPCGLTFGWMASLVDSIHHTPPKPTLAVRPSSSRQPESAQFHSGKKRLDLCTTSH